MKPSLEKKVVDVIRGLDDCFSLNGQTANLKALAYWQKRLRTVRDRLDIRNAPAKTRPLTATRGGAKALFVVK
jgi:hypothetical protein